MITIRPATTADVPAFMAWRGGDGYKNDVLQEHFDQHFAGERTIYLAMDGDYIAVQHPGRHPL